MKLLAVMALAALSFGSACADPYQDPVPPRDRLNYPVGLTIHPGGRFMYVVNSNFDTRYREDVGGTLSVIDLQTKELRPRSGPFLPSFGGFVELNRDASRAYVTARHSNSVVAFDVSPGGGTVFCTDAVSGPECSDGNACETGECVDGRCVVTTSDPTACRLQRIPDVAGGGRIPDDPFALDVTTLDWESEDGTPFELDLVNVAHLREENVTTISIPRRQSDEGALARATTMKFASLIAGGSALARRPGTRDVYVGGRLSRDIAIYFPYLAPDTGEVQALIRRGTVVLGNIGQSVDTRGMAFDESGNTLYVVTRTPDALHIVDLGPSDAETAGGTLGQVTTSIPIARNPSGVHPHTGPDGRTLLYVPSFDEEIIQVIDPETEGVVERIEIGAQPYDFAVDTAPDRCIPGAECRGYVTLFNDLPNADGRCEEHRTEPCGSVGIIDLNPDSPRYHQLIGKIF